MNQRILWNWSPVCLNSSGTLKVISPVLQQETAATIWIRTFPWQNGRQKSILIPACTASKRRTWFIRSKNCAETDRLRTENRVFMISGDGLFTTHFSTAVAVCFSSYSGKYSYLQNRLWKKSEHFPISHNHCAMSPLLRYRKPVPRE